MVLHLRHLLSKKIIMNGQTIDHYNLFHSCSFAICFHETEKVAVTSQTLNPNNAQGSYNGRFFK